MASTALTPYLPTILSASQSTGVDPALIAAVLTNESGNGAAIAAGRDPHKATVDPNIVSPAGAVGIAQFMPGTAAGFGITDLTDPSQEIPAAAQYLSGLHKRLGGGWNLAVAGYNAGPGAVEKYGGVPPYAETQAYVRNVLAAQQAFQAAPDIFGLPGIDSNVTNPPVLGQDEIGKTNITWNPLDPNYWKQTVNPDGTLNKDSRKTVAQINDPAGTIAQGLKDSAKAIADSQNKSVKNLTDTANLIALEYFVGALALTLIAGGLAWVVAANGPSISATAKL